MPNSAPDGAFAAGLFHIAVETNNLPATVAFFTNISGLHDGGVEASESPDLSRDHYYVAGGSFYDPASYPSSRSV